MRLLFLRLLCLRLRRCDGLRRCGVHGVRHDQRDEADVGASANPLQHHAADVDRGGDGALLQRVLARIVETGLDQIVKAEQGTRRIAGADQDAVTGKRRNWHRETLDQPLQPFRQRHGAA